MFETITKIAQSIFLSLILFLNSYGITTAEIPENKVVKVVDGDTIDVYFNKKVERIRLIGLNTPETADPRKGVQCYGKEASNRMKEILEGKIVKLEADESQTNTDKYGRLLRYVYHGNENINQKMISEGYGFEYSYKTPYKFQKDFKLSQQNAKNNNLGLWNKNNCDY